MSPPRRFPRVRRDVVQSFALNVYSKQHNPSRVIPGDSRSLSVAGLLAGTEEEGQRPERLGKARYEGMEEEKPIGTRQNETRRGEMRWEGGKVEVGRVLIISKALSVNHKQIKYIRTHKSATS